MSVGDRFLEFYSLKEVEFRVTIFSIAWEYCGYECELRFSFVFY